MRMSKKELLLETAAQIIEESGLEALTYESLAQASGMSKSGLIYHFPSRHALLKELCSYQTGSWERKMIESAGDTVENLDHKQRAAAYLQVLSHNASRADLLLSLDAHNMPEGKEEWTKISSDWSYPREIIMSDPKKYLTHVISDGLWIHDHINAFPLSDEERQALIDAALELLQG